MRITVAVVGKLKERYWREAVAEYSKRLGAYCRLEISEVGDEESREGLSAAEEEMVKQREWQKIARHLRAGTFLVALDIRGERATSEQLAARLDKLALTGHSDLTFLIGGSLGLSDAALLAAHWRLSFSPMTFPHQLMRVVLLEQIYRAYKISRHEPYHK